MESVFAGFYCITPDDLNEHMFFIMNQSTTNDYNYFSISKLEQARFWPWYEAENSDDVTMFETMDFDDDICHSYQRH